MNPARSFGPAVVITDLRHDVWKYHYIYWVGPLLGAGLAAGLYRYAIVNQCLVCNGSHVCMIAMYQSPCSTTFTVWVLCLGQPLHSIVL